MLTAFLPCRKGSQRITDKNIKPFAGVNGGLLRIKLDQLIACSKFDRILISSNDERVLEFASTVGEQRIVLDERPSHLGSSDTSTDELINYVPSLVDEGYVIWTHVTSPFVDELDYENYINVYFNSLTKGYDSLLTVKEVHSFLWDEEGAINYDRSIEKWPRTQTLKPIYEIDSAVFIAAIDIYKCFKDRIGKVPYLYKQDKFKSLDIDWPEDFAIAEMTFRHIYNI